MAEEAYVEGDGGAGPSLVVTVRLTPAYQNKLVNISPTSTNFVLPLIPGSRTVTTVTKMVGQLTHFRNPALMASMTLWYSFDPVGNTLTFCSNDLVDPDSTYVTTVPADTDQACNQHTYIDDTMPCGNNPNWNYCTPLTPGLQQELLQTVRAANQAVIDAAIAAQFTVIVRTPPPKVSAEDYAKLSAVYKDGVFEEFHDPDKTYGPEHTLVHFDSIWYGEITLNGADLFANVVGSTSDPKIASKSWINLWENQFGIATACTSLNYNGFVCGPGMAGGHVVLGTTAQNVPAGSNNVFIMPICSAHNHYTFTGTMAPLTYNQGIAIHNYLN